MVVVVVEGGFSRLREINAHEFAGADCLGVAVEQKEWLGDPDFPIYKMELLLVNSITKLLYWRVKRDQGNC